ncbi:MAG: hypothetical protein II820_05615 [Ruminiclostridium sp.]|nr:hypothetical protein [Ruminiclostridium sp.]
MQINEIIAMIAAAAIAAAFVIYLAANERERIAEWLKYAVAYAEKLLGGKTGQIKLRAVYDMFCGKFPLISAVLPFRVFSAWVDTALETLGDMLGGTADKETEDENGDIHG